MDDLEPNSTIFAIDIGTTSVKFNSYFNDGQKIIHCKDQFKIEKKECYYEPCSDHKVDLNRLLNMIHAKFSEFSKETLKKSNCNYLVVTGQMHGAAIKKFQNSGESSGEFWTWENSDCTKEFLDSNFVKQNIDFGRKIYSGYGVASLLLSAEQEKNRPDSESIYRAFRIECYGTIMDIYLTNFIRVLGLENNFAHQMTDQNAEAFGLYMTLKKNTESLIADQKDFPEIYEGIEHMKKGIISLQHNFMKAEYVKIVKSEELERELTWTIFPALADHQCSVFDQIHSVNKIRSRNRETNENKQTVSNNPLFLINLGTSCQLSQIVNQKTWNQLKSQHQEELEKDGWINGPQPRPYFKTSDEDDGRIDYLLTVASLNSGNVLSEFCETYNLDIECVANEARIFLENRLSDPSYYPKGITPETKAHLQKVFLTAFLDKRSSEGSYDYSNRESYSYDLAEVLDINQIGWLLALGHNYHFWNIRIFGERGFEDRYPKINAKTLFEKLLEKCDNNHSICFMILIFSIINNLLIMSKPLIEANTTSKKITTAKELKGVGKGLTEIPTIDLAISGGFYQKNKFIVDQALKRWEKIVKFNILDIDDGDASQGAALYVAESLKHLKNQKEKTKKTSRNQ